jgi:hypothetical protein
MGLWGDGPWQNDSALDVLDEVVDRAFELAEHWLKSMDDSSYFMSVIAHVTVATVLFEDSGGNPSYRSRCQRILDSGLDKLAEFEAMEDDNPEKIDGNRRVFVTACERLLAAVGKSNSE